MLQYETCQLCQAETMHTHIPCNWRNTDVCALVVTLPNITNRYPICKPCHDDIRRCKCIEKDTKCSAGCKCLDCKNLETIRNLLNERTDEDISSNNSGSDSETERMMDVMETVFGEGTIYHCYNDESDT